MVFYTLLMATFVLVNGIIAFKHPFWVTAEEKFALDFLENIVDVNMSAYVTPFVTITGDAIAPAVKVNLTNANGHHEAVFMFVRGQLCYYSLYTMYGTLVVKDLEEDCLTIANRTLEKYRLRYNKEHCAKFIQALENVFRPLQDQTVETEGITFKSTLYEDYWRLEWQYTIDGIVAPKGLAMHVSKNGYVTYFSDNWESVHISPDTKIIISKEQAINVTLALAEEKVKKLGAKIVQVNATLDFQPKGDAEEILAQFGYIMLHPVWLVDLRFDKLYKPGYFGFAATIQADTGEIWYESLQGFYYPPGMWPDEWKQTSGNRDFTLPLIIVIGTIVSIGLIITQRKRASQRRQKCAIQNF